MYIVPTGQLKILRGVPLDIDYQNTLYFAQGENSTQASVFSQYAKFSIDDHSYQRVRANVIRVGINAERLYDCNYLMFQNSVGFGSYMWFYAFITNITYVNNTVSEIEYVIDSLQTYLTYITFNMCFIERQHTVTDEVGDNIVPERLELGELVFNSYDDTLGFTAGTMTPVKATGGNVLETSSPSTYELPDMCIIVSTVTTNSSSGTLYDGTFSGSKLTAFPCNPSGVASVISLIQQHYQDPDTIQTMYMCPKFLTGLDTIATTGTDLPWNARGHKETFVGNPLTGNETLDGYSPINKKLYTYPYNFLHIDNANGSEINLRYEYFGKDNQNRRVPAVMIGGNVTYPLQIMLKPMNYKGDVGPLNTETLTINDYPMCSWNVDTYKVWQAQTTVPFFIRAYRDIGNAMVGGFAGALAGSPMMIAGSVSRGVQNLNSDINDRISEAYSASIAADMIKGNFTNKGANYSIGNQHFYFGRVSVQREYAKIIDDYFTRFGYAIKKLAVPNIAARPEFTYIKTIGCTIHGSVPADDEANICRIMDNGVTFWKTPANVGQYSINNAPV